jgi:hypothetical protein
VAEQGGGADAPRASCPGEVISGSGVTPGMFGRITLSWKNAPSRAPVIGPMVVTVNASPSRGPGIAVLPNPITSNMRRGPKSRAGLKEACESPARSMISSPTVEPTTSGKNQVKPCWP